MTGPETVGQANRRSMAFRARRSSPLPTREQSRRQSDLVIAAWRHFREAAPMIAFLNASNDALGAAPLQLAIASDEGLERVDRLLKQLTRET